MDVNWFSLIYSTQKSDCHCIGVSPGRAGVTFMSANETSPYCRGVAPFVRITPEARRQPPYARLDLCGPPGGGDGVTQRGDCACKPRETVLGRRGEPGPLSDGLRLWPITVEREQLMAATRLNDPLTADQLRAVLDYNPADRHLHLARSPPTSVQSAQFRSSLDTLPDPRTANMATSLFASTAGFVMRHRLGVALVHGRWPAAEIDHINEVRTEQPDWSNLRECHARRPE